MLKRFLDISFLTVNIAFSKKIISWFQKMSQQVTDIFILVLETYSDINRGSLRLRESRKSCVYLKRKDLWSPQVELGAGAWTFKRLACWLPLWANLGVTLFQSIKTATSQNSSNDQPWSLAVDCQCQAGRNLPLPERDLFSSNICELVSNSQYLERILSHQNKG